MIMWRDLSIRELYCLVAASGDYNGGYKSFISLIKKTASMMGRSARSTIELPSIEKWRTMNQSNFSPGFDFENRLFLVLDGTSLTLCNPKNHTFARALWVQYKKHTAYRYFIATTLDGTIVYLSGLYPGVVPDNTLYNDVGLREILADRYQPSEFVSFGLMGDKGYVGIQPPPEWALLLTKTAQAELENPSDQTNVPSLDSILTGRPTQRVLPEETVGICSTEIAKPRSIVEVSFGKVKRYRKLTSGHIRAVDDPVFLSDLVAIACYVANLIMTQTISCTSDNPRMASTRSEVDLTTDLPSERSSTSSLSPTILRGQQGRFSKQPTQTLAPG